MVRFFSFNFKIAFVYKRERKETGTLRLWKVDEEKIQRDYLLKALNYALSASFVDELGGGWRGVIFKTKLKKKKNALFAGFF